MMNHYDIIRRPVITEKTNIQKEEYNQISFEVDRRANRVEIARAIETIFKVKVAKTRTVQVKGKIKRRGRILGKRKDWKKAIVTLMPGERIDFFEGV
jgi:large subunit ribosomal protein L23